MTLTIKYQLKFCTYSTVAGNVQGCWLNIVQPFILYNAVTFSGNNESSVETNEKHCSSQELVFLMLQIQACENILTKKHYKTKVKIVNKQRLQLEGFFLSLFEHCKTLKCLIGGSGCII